VSARPAIALFTGDPAGVGPELTARLLADGEVAKRADIRLITSRAVMEEGLRAAGVRLDYEPMLVRWAGLDEGAFERGVAGAKNGRFMLEGLRVGLDLCRTGKAGAICFAPLNKAALRAGGMDHPDELHWFAETLAFDGTCVELNVLETLWTTRVTSHVALSEVSALITKEKVAQMTQLITESLRRSGVARPRIVVCGLNPHNGDNGRVRARGDRGDRSRRGARALARLSRGRAVSGGHGLRARNPQGRGLRRRGHHVPRPGADRDEAHGLRARGDRAGRAADADHDARARDRV
jgi:4-hydroxy-L-threonine phosphate dehydrogenase PdxA